MSSSSREKRTGSPVMPILCWRDNSVSACKKAATSASEWVRSCCKTVALMFLHLWCQDSHRACRGCIPKGCGLSQFQAKSGKGIIYTGAADYSGRNEGFHFNHH